jgi:thioredoxin reductase
VLNNSQPKKQSPKLLPIDAADSSIMAIDTPARLAILGAGPIGLDAALYARFLGYDVVVYERFDVAASVRQWGHVRMFTPFAMNRTTLGLAAIQAQDESYQPPADDEYLTGYEWVKRYLLPLANTDLLSDHLRLNTTVVSVGKEELLKGDMPGHEDRGDWSFRVLSRDGAGTEKVELFDGVLDCTGLFATANWLGHAGIPAIGELGMRDRIDYRLPDILGHDRHRYTGKHTLLVGGGMSAATNVVALAELAKQEPETRVTWVTRREGPAAAGGPITPIENDRLQQRAELTGKANELSRGGGAVTYWPRTVVEKITGSLTPPARQFEVELSGEHAGTIEVDEIIANVGFRPDSRIYEELQIHECYATQGPMKLAAALLGNESADCLDQKSGGPQALLNPEPNYYILGAKSYGRRSNFLLSVGYEQIREVFTLIGDRAALDLYAGATRLIR